MTSPRRPSRPQEQFVSGRETASGSGASTAPCVFCHPLDGRAPGRAITAGCVHEHMSTLYLCGTHERDARERVLWCKSCADAGQDKVPVRIVTSAQSDPSSEVGL